MTPEETVRELDDAFDQQDYAHVASLLSPDCEWTSVASGHVSKGKEAVIEGDRQMVAAFPDFRVDILSLISRGNLVGVEWRATGTNTGPLGGKSGTGKAFERRGAAFYEVQDGLVVRVRDYFDRATMFRQIERTDLL